MLGHWVLRGHGLWAVERKSDGTLIGRIGVQRPESWPATEVAWTLGRPYWGQGYATEAAKASLDWGFRTLPVPKLVSYRSRECRRRRSVAKRLGRPRAARQRSSPGNSFPVDVWEIPRERWSAADGRGVLLERTSRAMQYSRPKLVHQNRASFGRIFMTRPSTRALLGNGERRHRFCGFRHGTTPTPR